MFATSSKMFFWLSNLDISFGISWCFSIYPWDKPRLTGATTCREQTSLRIPIFQRKVLFENYAKKITFEDFWNIISGTSVTHQHQKANSVSVMKHPGLKQMTLSSGIQSNPVCYYQQWSSKRFWSSLGKVLIILILILLLSRDRLLLNMKTQSNYWSLS